MQAYTSFGTDAPLVTGLRFKRMTKAKRDCVQRLENTALRMIPPVESEDTTH